MLDHLTCAVFSDRVGDTFSVRLDDGSVLELELVSATEATGRTDERPGGGLPFSVVFRGPREPMLPQRIYSFEGGGLGVFEMFIVPTGPDGSGMAYQAVFG